MENWENLKVYRNLSPEEVPVRFKEFAHLIFEALEGHGFRLKETKTLKKLYTINDEFEQSIHFDNSSRWAKNKKDLHIYVCIKPLYSDKEQLYRIFEAFQIDASFKMFYPLTQEYRLLAESLTKKIEKHILPFFDEFSSSEKIVRNCKELVSYNDFPATVKSPFNPDLQQLLYECSFMQRNKSLFYKLNNEFLMERMEVYEQLKNDSVSESINEGLINGLRRQLQVFDNETLYEQEIDARHEKASKYVKSLKIQRRIR